MRRPISPEATRSGWRFAFKGVQATFDVFLTVVLRWRDDATACIRELPR